MSGTAMLNRKTMSTTAMTMFALAASAVVVVLLGAIPVAYAASGVVALPLLIVLVGAAIALLSVGYTTMARRVKHSAVYYSAIARGLGRPAGVGGGLIALLGYNAILTAQFGLFGTTAASLFGVGPWWAWAWGAAVLVAVFALRGITSSTVLLAVILIASLLIVVLFDTAALINPDGGHLTSAGFAAAGLTGGLGGGIAYAIASLMGFELPAAFREEKLTGASTKRAVFVALGLLVGIYAITAYALLAAVGPDHLATADPLAVLGDTYGPLLPSMARFVLLCAILTSMLAFATTVSRYTFAIAREEVLPRFLSLTGGGESPKGAAWAQTGISWLVIVGFAAAGSDPMATLFAWFSTLGALSLLLLLLLTSLSALFSLRDEAAEGETAWSRWVAPLLGVLAGAVLFSQMLFNLGALLGPDASVTTQWVIPLCVVVFGIVGVLWGLYLRGARPGVYQFIGRKIPDTNHAVDARLADLPL